MPAASIVNGCTGILTSAFAREVEDYTSVLLSAGHQHTPLAEVVASTIGTKLHCCEFWLPGGCNLRCRHCYVATWDGQPVMSTDEYHQLTSELVNQGLIDVVIPGMEPLLRSETWSILEAAEQAGARSIGITTNGTLLERHADRLAESALTVLNVSVDGPMDVHDAMRGKNVFLRVDRGIRRFREVSAKKLITNTTVTSLNHALLKEIAEIGWSWGVTYSAFHPFEFADEAENDLGVSPGCMADAYEKIISAFQGGKIGSAILEAEASTLDVILILAERGVLDDFELVQDEADFLFLRLASDEHELLVNLMFYPHHFIHTVRVADNGGLSSCRAMAHTGWSGMGDLRKSSLSHHLQRPDIRQGLEMIWCEFRAAVARTHQESLEAFVALLQSKVQRIPRPVARPFRLACTS